MLKGCISASRCSSAVVTIVTAHGGAVEVSSNERCDVPCAPPRASRRARRGLNAHFHLSHCTPYRIASHWCAPRIARCCLSHVPTLLCPRPLTGYERTGPWRKLSMLLLEPAEIQRSSWVNFDGRSGSLRSGKVRLGGKRRWLTCWKVVKSPGTLTRQLHK